MGVVMQRAGGGLSAADRAKLVPANIRQGVTLFEGTSKQVTGNLIPLAGRELIAMCSLWDGLIWSDGTNYTSSFTKAMTVDAYIYVVCDAYYACYGNVGGYSFGYTQPGSLSRKSSGIVSVNVSAGQTIRGTYNLYAWSDRAATGCYILVFKHK